MKAILPLCLALLATVLLPGCAASGKYRSFGPCRGFHQNPQACERAHENAGVAAGVQIGQTAASVRATMGRDPDRRSAVAGSESWWYLIDYRAQQHTVFVFTEGVVTEIKQVGRT